MKYCWTKNFLQKIFKLRNQHVHRHSNHLNTGHGPVVESWSKTRQNYVFYGIKGTVKERKSDQIGSQLFGIQMVAVVAI